MSSSKNSLLLWIIGIVVVGVIGGGLIKLLAPAFDDTLPSDFNIAAITPEDHLKGKADSKVVLMEYEDFQCPACGAFYPIVKRLAEEYGDRIAVVYRHFPLRAIHPHAEPLARAAEAAGMQGKFFEMHDMIYEKQSEWIKKTSVKKTIQEFAEALALDMDKFEADLKSDSVRQKVRTDSTGGRKAGISGTPTFFLIGQKIENPRSYEAFQTVIEKALEQAK